MMSGSISGIQSISQPAKVSIFSPSNELASYCFHLISLQRQCRCKCNEKTPTDSRTHSYAVSLPLFDIATTNFISLSTLWLKINEVRLTVKAMPVSSVA